MSRPTPSPTFPDELNLTRYFELVRRQWHVILLCGVLGAAAAFGWATLQPKTYTARADVAIVRTGTVVSFDSKIRTVSDTDPNALALDQVTRRRSLQAIGTSQALSADVIQVLGAELPESLRDPTRLAQRVSLINDGDLFTVQATADTPELAARIANVWAKEYEARVNEVFSEKPVSVELVRAQAADAKKDYDTQQAALVAFMQTNPIEPLKRQNALLIKQLDSQVNVENKLLQLKADAQALRSRLDAQGATVSSADELTQILIQASAFNNGGDAGPFRWDVTTSNETTVTVAQQRQQLDALLQAIETRRAAMSADQKQSLQREMNSVQAQLEQAQQQLKELQAARELAWNTYQSLNTKIAEVQVTTGAQNQLVRLASPAIVPTQPVASRRAISAVIGGLLGLVIGFVLALLLDFQRGRARVLKPAPQ